jgi:hypothetical protein
MGSSFFIHIYNPSHNIMIKVKFKKWNCIVTKAFYLNGRTALELESEKGGDPITVATVNIPELPLEADEVFIKDWSENEGMLKVLQDAKIIGPTIEEVPTGFVTAHKCKLLI